MQRVFAIDVLLCPSCGGRMNAIAEITDRRVAQTMLEHGERDDDGPARQLQEGSHAQAIRNARTTEAATIIVERA